MRTRTPSIRTLAALAYERGEEFDPALMLSPALAEQLENSTSTSGTTDLASWASLDAHRSNRQTAECGGIDDGEDDAPSRLVEAAPSWFEASDLAPQRPDARHGELLAELAR